MTTPCITDATATIYVRNLDTAIAFYVDTLGLSLEMRAGDHYAQLRAGPVAIGLHPASSIAPPPGAKGAISVGFMVKGSFDTYVKALQDKGVQFDGPIRNDGSIRVAQFDDPDGNPLYLASLPDDQ